MAKFKFAHIADVHLGHANGYGFMRQRRASGFATAWFSACEGIAAANVDFVLIAGDLFDTTTPRYIDRRDARTGLSMLDGVPVYAIYGNHDGHAPNDISPLYELDELGYLTLIDEPDVLQVIDGVNVAGFSWAGGATLDEAYEAIDMLATHEGDFNIFMAHCGIEGLMPFDAAEVLSTQVLGQIRAVADYLALGHIHKPYYSDRIVMPGSLEALHRGEARLDGAPMLVAVDGDKVTAEPLPVQKTAWQFETLDVSGVDPDHITDSLPVFGKDVICVLDIVGETSRPINRRLIRDTIGHVHFLQITDKTTVTNDAEAPVSVTDFFGEALGDDAALAMAVIDAIEHDGDVVGVVRKELGL